ncbi:hypothetical protein GCM10022226_74090 [Sphaerisporangium flaviroseum]|uniref:Integrase n=1 Tax=Sphaerisporangium flaviroseum TaxID=509199 RepID=A0ABP7JBV9_9ACTN
MTVESRDPDLDPAAEHGSPRAAAAAMPDTFVLAPSAVYRPGQLPGGPAGAGATSSGSSAGTGHERVPAARVAAAPPAPLVVSVGDIAGLRPRRYRDDGGEVPGPDVDLVDALDRDTFGVVAAWLRDSNSAATRQTRLQVLAAFLRWLDTLTPPVPLLAVTEDHLIAYRDAAATGRLTVGVRTPGKILSPATVAKQRNNLSSFFIYARRRKVLTHNPAADVIAPKVPRGGRTQALTRQERLHLRAGLQTLAEQGRLVEAAVIALLDDIAGRVGLLTGLTVGDIDTRTDINDRRHTVVTFRNKGGEYVHLPIADPLTRHLLNQLCKGRPATALLFTQHDGRPVDRWWASAALTAAAIAGGIPKQRAEQLHPHMLRATAITELLEDGAPAEQVRDAAQHASIDTTLDYRGRRTDLADHVLYRRAGANSMPADANPATEV